MLAVLSSQVCNIKIWNNCNYSECLYDKYCTNLSNQQIEGYCSLFLKFKKQEQQLTKQITLHEMSTQI